MTTDLLTSHCPTCRSGDRGDPSAASSCRNHAWHRGQLVHLQRDPLGTPGDQCGAVCAAAIDDPPSQLVVDREFVTCGSCREEYVSWRARLDLLADEVKQARHVMEVDEVVVERMDAEIDHLRAENAELRRICDRVRPVYEAARAWRGDTTNPTRSAELAEAVDAAAPAEQDQ